MRNKRMKNTPSETPDSGTRGIVAVSWVAVLVVMAFIFWMSARNAHEIDNDLGLITALRAGLVTLSTQLFGGPIDVSPVGHFAEFLLLGAALANALRFHVAPRKAGAYAFFLASLYGVLDEWHQLFVPQRSCDPLDWLVDTIAALLGAPLLHAIMRRRRARRLSTPGSNPSDR